jgi:ATP-binding cassette subfamily A (ABC1) protein 3
MISFYNNEETYFQNLILCGVIFENETNLNKELKYKLRFPSTRKHAARDPVKPIRTWWTQFTFPLFSKPGPRQEGNLTGGVLGYYEEGFLAVQHAVAMIVASHDEDDIEEKVEVYLQRFSYPHYIEVFKQK